MKRPLRSLLSVAAVAVLTTVCGRAASVPAEQIRAMLATLHENGEFNGAILVGSPGTELEFAL